MKELQKDAVPLILDITDHMDPEHDMLVIC